MQVGSYRGRGLSRFRTLNTAAFYVEIKDKSDIEEAFEAARERGLKVFVLGGGSNVFFENSEIKSAVIKNSLPAKIEHLGGDLYRVSSGLEMMQLLNFALKNSLDCCYYLASAPCQVGGAIAMNAGSGIKDGLSVSDFVESVEYFDGKRIIEAPKSDIDFGFRHTTFLEKETFIISAVLRLPRKKIDGNPIRERLEWARKNQDLESNNCGSLCDKYYAPILKLARMLFKFAPAGLSEKKLNWAVNKSDNPVWLKSLLRLISLLHSMLGKALKFEIRIVP